MLFDFNNYGAVSGTVMVVPPLSRMEQCPPVRFAGLEDSIRGFTVPVNTFCRLDIDTPKNITYHPSWNGRDNHTTSLLIFSQGISRILAIASWIGRKR
jgi:hypothetical protein